MFIKWKYDHAPDHVHVFKDRKELGVWDIDNQRPLEGLVLTRKLKSALRQADFLREG